MPLVNYNLEVVARLLRELDGDLATTGKIATLSHPDLILTKEALAEICGDEALRCRKREDSAQIIAWHKAHAILSEVYDTADLFKRIFSFDMTAFDITQGRGGEVIVDLSNPWPEYLFSRLGSHDIVFDCISNQVFNVAQCMQNAADLVRPGGYVVHSVPLNAVNQGFWNVSPTTYRDFYDNLGFKLVEHKLIVGIYDRKGSVPLDHQRRMKGVPDDAMHLVVAQRRADSPVSPPVTWPVMAKFKEFPDCKKSGSAP